MRSHIFGHSRKGSILFLKSICFIAEFFTGKLGRCSEGLRQSRDEPDYHTKLGKAILPQ